MSDTKRTIVVVCPDCSTSFDLWIDIDADLEHDHGLHLINGAWMGFCEACADDMVDASNAEYEAISRAAAELMKVHRVGPLSTIQIPDGEGFANEGETQFGFWAVPGYNGAGMFGGSDVFRRSANLIVDNLNANRGTRLVVNVNNTGTQAIIHGRHA